MRKGNNPLPALVAGALAVAALCALLLRDGWVLSVPILLALVPAVVGGSPTTLSRRTLSGRSTRCGITVTRSVSRVFGAAGS